MKRDEERNRRDTYDALAAPTPRRTNPHIINIPEATMRKTPHMLNPAV